MDFVLDILLATESSDSKFIVPVPIRFRTVKISIPTTSSRRFHCVIHSHVEITQLKKIAACQSRSKRRGVLVNWYYMIMSWNIDKRNAKNQTFVPKQYLRPIVIDIRYQFLRKDKLLKVVYSHMHCSLKLLMKRCPKQRQPDNALQADSWGHRY